jgi:hypothetical protein
MMLKYFNLQQHQNPPFFFFYDSLHAVESKKSLRMHPI